MRQREIKKMWLAALESGEYEQGYGQLYNKLNKAFCCLGVLQHCLLDGEVEVAETDEHPIFKEGDFIGLPSKWFYDKFPQLGWVKQEAFELAEMNDNGNSFKEIAAYIRSEWKVS